jgi:hypothetical protein
MPSCIAACGLECAEAHEAKWSACAGWNAGAVTGVPNDIMRDYAAVPWALFARLRLAA